MAIPISYNVRNLTLRKGLTIMTALGIALTVTTAVFLMALLAGLQKAFVASGDALNVLVMRKGSTAELSGGFDASLFPTLKELPGIARDNEGQPIASGEWVVVAVLPRKDGTGEVNVSVRGLMPAGLKLRPKAKLVEGRWFAPGQREIVVGKATHDRFAGTNVGDNMDFAKGQWKVVGIFDSGGTAYDSEIWGDLNQIAADFDRVGGLGSAYLRATDPLAADALKNRVSDDQRLKLEGQLETEYYQKQTSSGGAIKYIGFLVAIIMAVGSSFAAMNTMYAAVAYRSREIATLRVIGFSRPSILTSFVLESLLLSVLGALVGIALMMPFQGMSTGIGNSLTFSETVFSLNLFGSVPVSLFGLHFSANVLVTAVLFALVMGLAGGFAPSYHAARQEILAALRG
ncbi:MAG TPA: ABC transporter permease [Terriglobales bacterium]|nr:ABC transporter permease [Terriglobales bacterium]